MKLTKVRVTNFRSIEDSNEFDVGQLLGLVGKNEAGKTALLQALASINPHPATPITIDRERDYPRRHLTEYENRHNGKQAAVVRTEWHVNDGERAAIDNEFGKGALSDEPIVVTRRYASTEPEFELPINFAVVIRHLMDVHKLTAAEREPLQKAENTQTLRAALTAIEGRTEHQAALLTAIDALPGKHITPAMIAKVKTLLPQFMYFSHYDRMAGQIRLDTFAQRKSGQAQPPIDTAEQVFVDFLEYAGTSIEQIMGSQTYEGLNARCEAASTRISEQLNEYWTQNPHLEIEVRVTKAEAKDPAPFNEGVIARARVRNNLHKLTLPFSERSAGFIWFFSFLVKFAQVQKAAKSLILLLDEPGLTLHGKAQADLLRYFDEKLTPNHQVIYSTHSPFMVPADKLPSVLIVEDRVVSPRAGVWSSEGTKVRDDVLAIDRDTLFPLQGALGYEITQSLFIGKDTLLVEGPGDILYLQAWSAALERRGREKLDPRWAMCPAGGIDKIQPFVALFSGAKLNVAALTDFAKADKRKLEALSQILESDRLFTFATILGRPEADVEDVFTPELYAKVVNAAFKLPAADELTAVKIVAADASPRLLKRTEAAFRLLPPASPEFDHFTPAAWLIRNIAVLDEDTPIVNDTLNRAEKVISTVNKILAKK